MSQRVLIAELLRSRLGTRSSSAYEVTYYLWRRKRRPAPWSVTGRRRSAADDSDGEYTYEIWVVAIPRQLAADRALSAESASGPGGDLKQATADVAAGRVTGAIWKIDDLSEGNAARLIGMPDKLQGLVDEPLGALAGAVGMPAPAAAFTGNVAGALLLNPFMGPVESALHGLEIVGAIAGFVTGLPGLSALCLKHLVHDKITRLLSKAFSRGISGADKALDRQPSAGASPEAVGSLTRPATASRPPTTSEATRGRAGSEPWIPQGRTMRRTGRPPGSDADDGWGLPARTVPPEVTAKRLRSARSLHHRPAAAGAPVDTMSGLLEEPPLPADPPTLSNSPSAPDSRPGRITGMSR